MRAPHKSGALHYTEISFTRERVCPRCKQDLRFRGYNELCAECKNDPARIESHRVAYNRKQAKAARLRYHAKKALKDKQET